MRLSVIFLVVLAGSAILISMAAWGMTFGTSFEKVSDMAQVFTGLANESLGTSASLVSEVLRANAQQVDGLLALQRQSGYNRTEQTKAKVAQTIGTLVNYTTNATDQSQWQMQDVVGTFAALMSSVVADFRQMASGSAAQIRRDLATTAMLTTVGEMHNLDTMLRRFQWLVDLGLLNVSQRAPTDPVGEPDCTLLSLLCSEAQEQPAPSNAVLLASATGRLYMCGVEDGATVSVLSTSGNHYNESYWTWPAYAPTVPASAQKRILDRCLSEPPIVQLVGVQCSLPHGCHCGADPRCAPWYRMHLNGTTTHSSTDMFHSSSDVFYDLNTTTIHASKSLVDTSMTSLLGVIDVRSSMAAADMYFEVLTGFSNDLYIVGLINDTALTIVASSARKCAPTETAPGDPNLPLQSALRACDPSLRAVAEQLAANPSVFIPFSLEVCGYVLDVFPASAATSTYFFIVGANKSVINRAVDASDAWASAQLSAVRSRLIKAVVADGDSTKSYIAALGVQNNQELQAMQDSFMVEIQALENASRVAVARSQQLSTDSVNHFTEKQSTAVKAQKSSYLSQMTAISGLTIGVVLAILLLVLLLAACGTFRVTTSLTHIIGLMEDVADMRVEDLAVPQRSSVAEVARIQAALQVLISRIAEYKSYIPAGVLDRSQDAGTRVADYEASPHSDSDLERTGSVAGSADRQISHALSETSGLAPRRPTKVSGVSANCTPAPANWRSLRRNVAVLSVNVVGCVDVLRASNDGVSRGVLDDYVACIHQVVAQHRGNIDCLFEDQALVTFNAHLPCADPAAAAAVAALELQSSLLSRLGDRLKFQIGMSFGPVFASSVGYAKFKFMVTVGGPMKLASWLSCVPCLENGAIVLDAALEERLKYSYSLRPLELVHLPHLITLARNYAASQCIFLLLNTKHLKEDEWIYQVEEVAVSSSDWSLVFDHLVEANFPEDQQTHLCDYIVKHPHDAVALRLRERLHLWSPGRGIPSLLS
eukprot:EG_transcript_1299